MNLLLPNRCVLCHMPTKHDFALCRGCIKDLPVWHNRCRCCGSEMTAYCKQQLCGNCIITNPPFTKAVMGYRYQFPIDHLITKLKFNGQLINATILGTLLTKKIRKYYHEDRLPTLILPVPLHKKRLRERGFNQAMEIAKPISKTLNISISHNNCQRIKNTTAQSSLPEKQRQKNIRKAFIINKPITAKHIAIIDDVVTTGNTVKELSALLRKHGVQRIDIWCAAKTTQHPSQSNFTSVAHRRKHQP